MASDHRGRPLHAGKRTTQDMPNAVSGWSEGEHGRQIPNISEDVAFEKGDVPYKMGGSVRQNAFGRWDAEVWRAHDFDSYGASYAESSHALDLDALDYDRSFRTEKRAKIAVEAMINRRNEGRDSKTGRGPHWPKGSRPGHAY